MVKKLLNNTSEMPLAMRRIQRIHFVGIGGAGMSGIAEVLLNQGYQISGSDLNLNSVTERLIQLGAEITQGHAPENIKRADVVVQSTAIPDKNPEITAAKKARIPIVPRAEMLAELMRFRYGIAVSGTHGKTTTTSLVASVLAEAGMDPTFIIGGRLNSVGSNARLGASPYLVAEADESDASFLFLKPMMTVITNIDADHMETYDDDFEKLKQTFLRFMHHLPFYGLAVLCTDDLVVREILPQVKRPVLTYGFNEEADVQAISYRLEDMISYVDVKRYGSHANLSFQLNLPGKHNVLNALAAVTIATELGVADNAISSALANFAGIGRRFQILGDVKAGSDKALLIDDYGHHPREIEATIETVRSVWPDKRLVMVFQPHRFSRTHALFEDFVDVLSTVDCLLLLDIYSAGEKPIDNINSAKIVENITKKYSRNAIHIADEKQLPQQLQQVLQSNDILLTQGAGSIGMLANQLLEQLQ